MPVGMATQVVSVIFQAFNEPGKCGIPVKISCKKKGCFYIFLSQCVCNKITAIPKFVSSKNNGDGFHARVAPYYSTLVVAEFLVQLTG